MRKQSAISGVGVFACASLLAIVSFTLTLTFGTSTVAHARPDMVVANPPPARCCASMAYDSATSSLVMYGGATMAGDLGDTFSFNGSSWNQLSPLTSPGILYDSAMAYDAATNSIIVFGGRGEDSQYVSGTWLWNGNNWNLATPAMSPPPRAEANLAYDAANGTVVLWGGCCDTSGALLTDTFVWEGGNWEKKTPATSPPGSEGASMAYDTATGTVVLLVPFNGSSTTWSWDGTNWTQQQSEASPTYGGSMAYDATTQSIVLFQVDGTTWTWTSSGWAEQLPTTAPDARGQAAMAYDSATQTLVLFGGSDAGFPQDDSWAWDGTNWTALTAQADARTQKIRR